MDPARTAAQRAFFAAALGQPTASAQAETATPAPRTPPTRAPEAAAAGGQSPRILRPGSIIDIRV